MKNARYFFYVFMIFIMPFLHSCSAGKTPVQISSPVQTLPASIQHSPTQSNPTLMETPSPLPLSASPTTAVIKTGTPTPTSTYQPTITPIPLATIPVDSEGEIVFLDNEDWQDTKLMKLEVDKSGKAKSQEPKLITDVLPNYGELMDGMNDILPSPDGNKIISNLLTEGPSYLVYDIPLGKTDHPYYGSDANFIGWHPDSKRILLRNNYRAVWSSDVMGGQDILLAKPHKEFEQIISAAASPDGKQVIYSHTVFQPYGGELWMVGVDGKDERKLFDTKTQVIYLAWSPDGTMIAYYDDGYWVMNADGTNQRKLSDMPSRRYLPILWSPDSQMLLVDYGNFVDNRRVDFASSNIYLIDVKSGEVRTILPNGSRGHLYPAWSPDGQKIAFISIRGGKPDIWIINRDGTDLHQVTKGGHMIRDLFWRKP